MLKWIEHEEIPIYINMHCVDCCWDILYSIQNSKR